MRSLPVALGAALLLGGCRAEGPTPVRAGPLQHVVLITLKDAAEADALIRDMESLRPVPGLLRLHVGRHRDTGRAEVSGDYSVGAVFEFSSVDALRAYNDHPAHRALLERWVPKVASLRVFDVEDETP